MCYIAPHNEKHPRIRAPRPGAYFFGAFSRNRQERRDFHARAVAEKTRRSKKSAAGMSRKATKPSSRASRRPSQSTRASAHRRVSVAKPAHRRKPEAEGAALGMNAKKTTQRQGFKTHEFIVYPAHGVGQIVAIEEQEVAGARLELFVINFVKDKMTLRVPTSKVASVGMRKLAETPMVKRALETLKGRARDQAHHVVAARAGIRGQDQFRRHRRHRRGRARPLPVGHAAGTVLFRAPALRGCARSAVARSRPSCSGSPRPKRSRRSRRRLPRDRVAVRSPRRKKKSVVEEEAA